MAVGDRDRARQGRRPDERVEAAPVAAAAHGAVLVDRHVADLPGRARAAPVDPAVEDDPGTDPVGGLQVTAVPDADEGSADQLPLRGEVGRVVEDHRDAQGGLELPGGGHASPPRQDRLGPDVTGDGVDGGRQSQGDGPQVGACGARRIEHVAHQSRGPAQTLVGDVVRGQRKTHPRAQVPRTGPQREADVPVPEGDTGDDAPPADGRDERGPAPVADGSRGLHLAVGDEVPHEVRHGRGAEPGRRRDLDLGQRAVPVERLEDPPPVRGAQGGLGPRCPPQ